MSNRNFKLSADQIKPLVSGMGSCIATDMITVNGQPVRFMYREEPTDRFDSGWRFVSGLEDDDYMDNPDHLALYDVNTIANYDPRIVPMLDAVIGSAFECAGAEAPFIAVTDWQPPDE